MKRDREKKRLPSWSDTPYAGETRVPPPLDPHAGSWPMYHLYRNAKGFTDLKGRAITLEIQQPDTIDFIGQQLRKVKETLSSLTNVQVQIARYWNSGPPTKQWTPVIDKLIDTYGISGPYASRILAAVHAGIHDITIVTWFLKYQWQIPRPNQLDQDLATLLCTPYHPTYPAGHGAVAGCVQAVLSYFFPPEAARLKALAEECGVSRVYGGVHFPADIEQGLRLGRQIGRLVVSTLDIQKMNGRQPIDNPPNKDLHASLAPPPYEQAIPFHYRFHCQSKLMETPPLQTPSPKKKRAKSDRKG
jgi:hypothetical protein